MRRIVGAIAILLGLMLGPLSMPSHASCAAGFGTDEMTLEMPRVISGTVTDVSGKIATINVDQIWVGEPVAPKFRFYTSSAQGPIAHSSEDATVEVGTKYLVGLDSSNTTSLCSLIPFDQVTLQVSADQIKQPMGNGDQGVKPSIEDKIVGANKFSLAFALAVLVAFVIYLKRRADKEMFE
jgi:hypothetical protein